jgi:hypothetical protein
MFLNNWIANLPMGYKLILGLGVGLVSYGLFRFFVYKVNKMIAEDMQNRKHKKLTPEQRIRNAMAE